MNLRILLAGLIGGVLVFFAGAAEHTALQWGDRTMRPLPDEPQVLEFIKSQNLSRGLYSFPEVPQQAREAGQEKLADEINERFKAGPNGLLLIGPTGEDMMGGKQLGLEVLTNILAALIAAWIVSLMRPDVSFCHRWTAVLLIGVAAWLSQNASYSIWYRFPGTLARDELFCVLLEWGVSGLFIAKLAASRPAKQTEPLKV